MNVLSHIAYPVLFAQSANILKIRKGETPPFNKKKLLLIGICGALPDILSPHLGLQERYNSFWHSLYFLLLSAAAVIILTRIKAKHRQLIYFCAFATAFHLLCDMIAGGINLYGPFGRFVIGTYLVPFQYWISLDAAGILFLIATMAFSHCPVRARPFTLVLGCVIALCGTALVFTALDLEAFLTKGIPASEITKSQLDETRHVWDNLLSGWQKGNFEPLSDDYTAKLQKEFAPQSQKQFYERMKNTYGDYQGLVLVEVIVPRFYFPRMTMYRFLGVFSKTLLRPEIDIVLDHRGKVSKLMFRDKWREKIL